MATAPHGTLDVVHDPEAGHFVLRRAGVPIGIVVYERAADADGEVLDLLEARVFPEARGQGLGGLMVRDALRTCAEAGWRIRPTGWFIRAFVEANDEFADLVADPAPVVLA